MLSDDVATAITVRNSAVANVAVNRLPLGICGSAQNESGKVAVKLETALPYAV